MCGRPYFSSLFCLEMFIYLGTHLNVLRAKEVIIEAHLKKWQYFGIIYSNYEKAGIAMLNKSIIQYNHKMKMARILYKMNAGFFYFDNSHW